MAARSVPGDSDFVSLNDDDHHFDEEYDHDTHLHDRTWAQSKRKAIMHKRGVARDNKAKLQGRFASVPEDC